MTFKKEWEKSEELHPLSAELIAGMVAWALPQNKLLSYEPVLGGCSNLNIKITISDYEVPLILRVYCADPEAACREQALAHLLHPSVPVPRTYYVGHYQGASFAIIEFKKGIPLRDLLLSDQKYNLELIMQSVGALLAKIAKHSFSKPGLFDKKLQIIENSPSYLGFLYHVLEQPSVKSHFTDSILLSIKDYLTRYGSLFPSQEAKNLVHGDFDPANILVDQSDGTWNVTAVLDWEFSFSGSILCDIANMLRYAHQMPVVFETAFLSALQEAGVGLPPDWKRRTDLLNLLALLDCLQRTDPLKSPHQCADICALVERIIETGLPA